MMEAILRTCGGRLTLKVQAEKQKDLFRQVAIAQEVFDSETECGCCNSDRIHFQVRTVDSMEFFELICLGCGARFEFGQHKNGNSLFPKRRDEHGALLPNRGWARWEKPDGRGRTKSWEDHDAARP